MADPVFEARLAALVRSLYGGVWQQENVCIPAESDLEVPHIMGRVPDFIEIGDPPTLSDWYGGQAIAGDCLPFSHWFANEELVPVAIPPGELPRPEGHPLVEEMDVNAARVRIRNWTPTPQDVGVLIMCRQGRVPAADVADVEGLLGVWMEFRGTPRAGAAPLDVTFFDISTYTDQKTPTGWDWDWGDGTPHGVVQNPPAHTYAAPGTFTVILTVTFADGTTVAVTKTNYVVAA